MQHQLLELEDQVGELREELRYLRTEVAKLRKEVRPGGPGGLVRHLEPDEISAPEASIAAGSYTFVDEEVSTIGGQGSVHGLIATPTGAGVLVEEQGAVGQPSAALSYPRPITWPERSDCSFSPSSSSRRSPRCLRTWRDSPVLEVVVGGKVLRRPVFPALAGFPIARVWWKGDPIWDLQCSLASPRRGKGEGLLSRLALAGLRATELIYGSWGGGSRGRGWFQFTFACWP